MKHLKLFLYLFFLHTVFGLASFYNRKTIDQPFSELDAVDIISFIITSLIFVSFIFLINDLFIRFNNISKLSKIILFIISLFISIVTLGFILKV